MAEHGHERIADGVDAAPVVGEVDAERAVVPQQRGPERIARGDRAVKNVVRQRPGVRPRLVERRAAPAVSDELDVVALRSFGCGRALRTQRFQIGILRGEKRQRGVVEHQPDDDRSADGAVVANAPARLRHVPFAGAEGEHLFEHFPIATGRRLVPRRRVLGQVQCEPADERAVGGVQLDGGRQAIAREIGVQPHGERAFRGRPRRAAQEIRQRRQGVDLIERLAEAAAQLVALRDGLRRIFGFDQPLLAGDTEGEE